jgi:RNA polymerase sigma-70 factor
VTTPEPVSTSLAAAFLSRWPPDLDSGSLLELEQAIDRAHERGRAAWPDVHVSVDEFAAYLGERCDPSPSAATAIGGLHQTDLYLACGCTLGLHGAAAALDAHFLTRVRPVLARFDSSPSFADEMIQRLRVMLLVGREEMAEYREPKIGLYRGKASLSRWLAVIATRAAIDERRGHERATTLDEVLDVASAESPELELLRRRHLGDFRRLVKDALSETIVGLTPEARNLLRWHLVENLSLRKIAVLRGSNVSAVSREYARLRSTIRDSVVDRLRTRTGMPINELNSLMGVLISRISIAGGLSVTMGR